MHKLKPLGHKSYGSIGHLPGSGVGQGDHFITEGQASIAQGKVRDSYDRITVLEKLDGSNVAVAKIDGLTVPLVRAGYAAWTSPYRQHHRFAEWAQHHFERFSDVLREGERLCGEWLLQQHGTRYALSHEPFVVFDMFSPNNERYTWEDIQKRVGDRFLLASTLARHPAPTTVKAVMLEIQRHNYHGALDAPEGAVWRVERKGKVDFLCKYVRPDFVAGQYLDKERWNIFPTDDWLKKRLF